MQDVPGYGWIRPPALMAGLSRVRANVALGPPLSARTPSSGSVIRTLSAPPQEASSEIIVPSYDRLELEKLTQLRTGTPLCAMIELFRIVSPFTPELPRASMPGAGPFRTTVLL